MAGKSTRRAKPIRISRDGESGPSEARLFRVRDIRRFFTILYGVGNVRTRTCELIERIARDWLFAGAFLVGLLTAEIANAAEAIDVEWSALRDVSNRQLNSAPGGWKVVCFLGTDCPLARLYASRLKLLSAEFSPQHVQFIGINSNPQDSPADVLRYIHEQELTFPIVKDAGQRLAIQFHVTRTPEVFVVDPSGQIGYQGRIDNQYEPGQSRTQPTQHDLRDALSAMLAGKAVARPKTAAVGCLITSIKPSLSSAASQPQVTFTRDVSRVLNRHCVECHRPGEIGPFALTEYDEVAGWSQMILEVIEQGRMPPWHADSRYGKFVGQRAVPARDRDTLVTWVAQGLPVGDPSDLPPLPERILGWQLSTPPDLEIAMRDRAFPVPAEGTVEYQYFVVDPHWDEDRWIRAAQVRPGKAAVVHHAIVFVRPPDGSEMHGIGWLGAYVPGQRIPELPPGHARKIPAGSKLVFQMHYTPNGRATQDVTRVGVWFSNSAEVTHEVVTRVALNHDFEIPPRSSRHQVELQLTGFPPESRLLSATPHMHVRGKAFQLDALRGSQRETLLGVPRYDFNWQHCYQFETPLALDEIDSLEMKMVYDNSSNNASNPSPDEYVTWGDQTWEEMAVAFFDVARPRRPVTEALPRNPKDRKPDSGDHARLIEQRVAAFLADMDQDRDGIVTRDEVPLAFRRFGFRKLDGNRDDRLDRSEIEAAAAQRR